MDGSVCERGHQPWHTTPTLAAPASSDPIDRQPTRPPAAAHGSRPLSYLVAVIVQVEPHDKVLCRSIVDHLRALDDERTGFPGDLDLRLTQHGALIGPRPRDVRCGVAVDPVIREVRRLLALPVPIPSLVRGRLKHPSAVRFDALALGVVPVCAGSVEAGVDDVVRRRRRRRQEEQDRAHF